ncbi:putative transcription factor GRAS family [Helianthus annuus]|uniref:Transcription factor GRAS family n=3 Tax=Helianthus annuus TaxID=4232 RepID=A0A9K3H9D2_HELAN|nr:putative transcription factor GRAS family [Helianthus annuus]KAJ0476162.1 putative transcription factor GRAS family [Helianthus annuus]KAJ0480250.1 putative transcription factor GRAS family [Helianthus annuus]KAJ0496969.1 putative transcription factor GRAS family [Helianthus annuus]KAJ0662999.1 putative transcription factor GRAS family [Helianthus annuus]
MAFEVATFQQSLKEPNKLKEASYGSNNNSNSNEPISVLDTRRSPSPSTSTSTHSSSFNGGATTTPPPPPVSDQDNPQQKWPESVPQEKGFSGYDPNFPATADGGRKDEWPELQPIPADFELQQQRFGVSLEDWESLLSEPTASQAQDQSLRWISGDFDDSSLSLQQLLQSNPNDQNAPVSNVSETTQLPLSFNQQNPNLFPFSNSDQNPPVVFNNPPPPPQIHLQKSPVFNHALHKVPVFQQNLQKVPVSNLGHEKDPVSNMGLQKVVILNQGLQKVVLNQGYELVDKKPLMVAGTKQETGPNSPQNHHQQYQLICDQLFAAAELTLSGNFSHAQGILARLNHQFASAPAPTKPFQRAAFYFKEALQMQSQSSLNQNRVAPPFNGLFKMGAYKMLSEVSPIIQFMNFTSNQTILEALGDAKNIHIIDFNIGFGAQWASFIQELPTRNNGGGGGSGCSLKITAFASPSTHNPIELGLMHENLSQFAQEIGISFELEVVNFDSFDPRSFSISENETVAVNLPIWSASTHLSAIPSILHFVKQLSPRIVVSFDRGCERTDLPFPHYLLQGLQYYELLLDSIDGANVVPDVSNKMERFLFQPQIERMVSGKLQFPEPMPHWKSLFTAGGYSSVLFSNFAETQADCVVKRMQVQGFHIEKKQASLVLCWQNRELMTASAWKC